MANWCYNVVQFSGDEQKISEIDALFKAMAEREKQTREGQLPPFVEAGEGYFHDIYVEDGTIRYETKWVQNTDILVQVADHFRTGFWHEYYEPGMWIYGQAEYGSEGLSDVSIDPESVELIEYRESGGYRFEGQDYETDMEIMELLFERKIEGLEQERGRGR
ncbi:hypothetical protein [Elizabethkingia anophelis]|uniref:DUF1281 family ferredoxin-like fold protein n=1 Tax=Elizabethkingia anophelis TaxID=1117645 RepID=UPI0012B1F9BB|nr:hypothetical protein [Elizabethkingia anophelis]QGN22505.1 hypothetical protein GJV56_07640 [Elizabethkingia anophelis]QNV09157.1 hypothetical protein EIY88_07620 [Elizabethkingia anophelis]UTF90913.1 hypothetical protein J2N93_07685 [Elizabethkingia anophelis]UTG01783.1 hypothetical protein J2O04_07690 [Elizabethkingia anophelis]UTG05533.1 hypothetical protein J2O03_07685 [Elizabethkingia anophelis]